MSLPEQVEYPFAVVYSTESASYRRATVAERDDQIHRQAQVALELEAWKADQRPDALDKWWAGRQELVSLISRSPHGVKRSRHSKASYRTRHAAVETLLAVVPRGYGKRDGVIEW